jgi:hypothetical protein
MLLPVKRCHSVAWSKQRSFLASQWLNSLTPILIMAMVISSSDTIGTSTEASIPALKLRSTNVYLL